MYIRCAIPEQGADPSALTILTLTLADGYTDRIGRTGDIDYRFTMCVEQHAWKITKVCEIIAKGCFDVSWG